MNISTEPAPTITRLDVQIDSNKKTEVYFFAHMLGNAAPIGMLVICIEDDEHAGWISRVFVEAEYRGRGIATSLLSLAADLAKEKERGFLSLSVKNENETAQRVYKALGFVPFMTGQEGYAQFLKVL